MNQTALIVLLSIGFPLFFVAMWLFVTRLISWGGWSKYARHFAWDQPFPERATRFSYATVIFGRWPVAASYRNGVHVWLDDRGIFMRPMVLFRLFHPPLHIGWDSIEHVEAAQVLQKIYRVRVARGLPLLTFGGKAGKAVLDHWEALPRRKAA